MIKEINELKRFPTDLAKNQRIDKFFFFFFKDANLMHIEEFQSIDMLYIREDKQTNEWQINQ